MPLKKILSGFIATFLKFDDVRSNLPTQGSNRYRSLKFSSFKCSVTHFTPIICRYKIPATVP